MNCKECGAPFAPRRMDQRFCSASHGVTYCQKKKRREALINASTEIDGLTLEIERLRVEKLQRDEYLKGIINRYKEIADQREAEIDRLEDTIKERNIEIERLKAEKKSVVNRPATMLNRDHLQDVLNKELRRQFPKNSELQAHIGAIRAFNASYINALVTQP
jgi:hypothetical protein